MKGGPAAAARPSPEFTAEEARAILDGKVSEFRIPLALQPPTLAAVYGACGTGFGIQPATWMGCPGEFHVTGPVGVVLDLAGLPNNHRWTCPIGEPGNWLWLREPWKVQGANPKKGAVQVQYEASTPGRGCATDTWARYHALFESRYRRAATMPVWAARASLEVVSVSIALPRQPERGGTWTLNPEATGDEAEWVIAFHLHRLEGA